MHMILIQTCPTLASASWFAPPSLVVSPADPLPYHTGSNQIVIQVVTTNTQGE